MAAPQTCTGSCRPSFGRTRAEAPAERWRRRPRLPLRPDLVAGPFDAGAYGRGQRIVGRLRVRLTVRSAGCEPLLPLHVRDEVAAGHAHHGGKWRSGSGLSLGELLEPLEALPLIPVERDVE